MTKALTTETFVARARELHGARYNYDKTVYVRSQARVTITCAVHGDFLALPNNHISASNLCGCPRCGGTGVYSFAEFLARATLVHGGYTYAAESYVNANTPMHITCPTHGGFMQTPTRHMAGRGCPVCGGTTLQSTASVLQRCAAVHGGKYSYALIPPDARLTTAVPIVCAKHGVFTQLLKLHAGRGYGCPNCSGRVSVGEREIAAYIAGLGFTTQLNNRKVTPGCEIDVYVPSARVGVEFHGVYWHTHSRVGMLHLKKWEAAQAAGVRLLQVFDDEWADKKEVVKARIAAVLGCAPKFDARKCVLEKIPAVEGAAFLAAVHLQGSGRAAHYYGLRMLGALVAVASFGRARSGAMTGTKEEGAWEVVRYASTGRVRGGFSKLLARFKQDALPRSIVSYCDLRYGDGGLYLATGFKLEAVTPPDYWWVQQGKHTRISRYKTQKHKLAAHPVLGAFYAEDKTELQICAAAGWEKIYGVGHQRWIWRP